MNRHLGVLGFVVMLAIFSSGFSLVIILNESGANTSTPFYAFLSILLNLVFILFTVILINRANDAAETVHTVELGYQNTLKPVAKTSTGDCIFAFNERGEIVRYLLTKHYDADFAAELDKIPLIEDLPTLRTLQRTYDVRSEACPTFHGKGFCVGISPGTADQPKT